MKLSEIRAGEWVIINTDILVFANQQKSVECMQLLKRCASREVIGIVPLQVVSELVHILMLIEARENGWIEKINPEQSLSVRQDLVRRLSRYETQVREFIGIGLRIEAATATDIIYAMTVQREFGLMMNESLLLAVARRLNCSAVASADKAFTVMHGFMVYEPGDLTE